MASDSRRAEEGKRRAGEEADGCSDSSTSRLLDSRLVIGVDGGSSKTIAVVAELDGRLLGVGRAGGSNWESIGIEQAASVITEAARQALEMAGASLGDVVRAHMGLAGMDWPDDEPRMAEALAALGWQCPISIENDAFLALRACSPDGYGLGATAGSGVCCGIIQPDGSKFFYGAFTDMGGGIDIGAQVVHAVLRQEDGRGPATMLTGALLAATGHKSVIELARAMHRGGYHITKRMTDPILFSCAAKGDPVAVGIVTRFGRELALCTTNLIRRYRPEMEDRAVVAAGSLFQKTGPLLFSAFRQEVLKVAPRARLILADQPPVMGAVRGALMAAGRENETVWGTAQQTAAEQGWFRKDVGAAAGDTDNG
ncbi:MAG: N-acetylglucosamine kinase [Armatimonadota bacterium]